MTVVEVDEFLVVAHAGRLQLVIVGEVVRQAHVPLALEPAQALPGGLQAAWSAQAGSPPTWSRRPAST
mgnify:CR=1 FL=1